MSAVADIRTGMGGLRRIRPVAEQRQRRRSGAGAFFASAGVFLLFIAISVLFLFVPAKPEIVLVLAAAMTVVLAIIRWPIVGTFTCLILAVNFDSLPSPWYNNVISELGVFRNLSYKGLPQFVWISIFELLVVLTLSSAVVRRWHSHRRLLRGALFPPIMLFGAMVLFGEINGLMTGGDFKISLWELRPLFYVVALYLLAVNTIKEPSQIKAVIWISILAVFARSLDGISRYFAMTPDMRAVASTVLEHDDSLLLSVVLAMLVPVFLWRARLQKRLVWALVLLAPFALYTIVINHRRAAYFCLLLILASMVPLIWTSFNSRKARFRLVLLIAGTTVVLGLYVAAFWNGYGSLAQPAQAVRSVIAPSERDYLSNLYRDQENTNLNATIAQSPVVGIGFGKPMKVVVQMASLLDQWSLQLYMPHNNMLWLWMRMGIIGFAVFWLLVGSSLMLTGASLRLGLARMRLLLSEEKSNDPSDARASARGLSGLGLGLRVVHRGKKQEEIPPSRLREGKAAIAHQEQVRECAEFIMLAFLADAVLASMLTLAVVDQGLMSPRLSSYWGILLGTLAVAWELYRVKYRSALPKPVAAQRRTRYIYKESQRGQGIRVRVISGPKVAP